MPHPMGESPMHAVLSRAVNMIATVAGKVKVELRIFINLFLFFLNLNKIFIVWCLLSGTSERNHVVRALSQMGLCNSSVTNY